jgi:hypothetical protein
MTQFLHFCFCLFVWLFACFESHEQFFSYLATVTITSERAVNLDLCLAFTVSWSEGSFTCHTYCDKGPPFLRSYPTEPWFSLLNVVLLTKEQSLPISNVLGLTRPVLRAGLELTISRMLSESTTTRLQQPVHFCNNLPFEEDLTFFFYIISPLKRTWPFTPVRSLVRISPSRPLVCRKRRQKGVILRMRPEKPRPRVTIGVVW